MRSPLVPIVVSPSSSYTERIAAEELSAGLASFWSFDGTLNDQAGAVEDNLIAVGTDGRFVTADQLPATSGKALGLGVFLIAVFRKKK